MKTTRFGARRFLVGSLTVLALSSLTFSASARLLIFGSSGQDFTVNTTAFANPGFEFNSVDALAESTPSEKVITIALAAPASIGQFASADGPKSKPASGGQAIPNAPMLPEPSTFSMFALASLLFVSRKIRARK